MKLMSLFFFFMAINVGLLLFSIAPNAANMNQNTSLYPGSTLLSMDPANPGFNSTVPNTIDTNQSKYSIGGYTGQDLWSAWLFPGGGNNSRIIVYLIAFALLIGALGFTPFINRSDLSVLSGPFLILIVIGGPTCYALYDFINRQTASFACVMNQGCMISNLFGAIVGGTLFIAWIFSCLEWWTGRPTGP